MLPDDALQRFALEHATHHGAGREQLLADVVAQAVLEPVAERNGESLLLAPEELGGKVALHGLAQEIFLPAPRQLGVERDAVHQLGEMVIEKWRPHLQTVRHAHAIHLDQHVVGKTDLLLPKRHAGKR